jgi:arsenite methyltransferase
MSQAQANYGMDAPGVIRIMFLTGAAALLLATLLPALGIPNLHFRIGEVNVVFPWRSLLGTGLGCMAAGLLMTYYSTVGKFKLRDRILNMVAWKGDEHVLDVGTGRGLLLIGAAKRLTSGCAVGIDIWSAKDLSENAMENTLQNAEIEGVRQRVEVKTEDATAMSFPDNTFDVILTNACIHNIPSAAGREQACREIVRVLKPGGQALISDFVNSGKYKKACQAAGAQAAIAGSHLLMMKIVAVRK